MSKLYKREGKHGDPVYWGPEDEDGDNSLAVQAMEESGVIPDHVELPDDAPVSLDPGEARDVRERYRELVEEESGG